MDGYPTWRMPANGVPMSGAESETACQAVGQRLCTYDELCPSGSGSAPQGMPAEHTDWMPYYEASYGRPGWIGGGCGIHELRYSDVADKACSLQCCGHGWCTTPGVDACSSTSVAANGYSGSCKGTFACCSMPPPFPPGLAPTPPPPAPPCYDDSACTSPDGHGGTDCWAGSKVQPCSCSHGYAKSTGATIQHEGITYHKYKCCPDGGGEGECGDFDMRGRQRAAQLAAENRAYATAVSAVVVLLLLWAVCSCIGLAAQAWRAWRRPAMTAAPQTDTTGSRTPLRRASTLEKIGSLARIQQHGKPSDKPSTEKRSSWMALIHIVPVALVQFLDFSSDVVVLAKMFQPDQSHGFVYSARGIMLMFIFASILGAWLALATVLPQQVPRSARGACTVLVALALAPINFHVLFVGCLYANLVSRIVDEEGAKQADMMYELFVLLKLAEASIESFVLGCFSLMIFGLGATDAPWLLVSSSALSLLSLTYGIFAYLARKYEAALPSGTRVQLFFWVFLHILFMLFNGVYGVVTALSRQAELDTSSRTDAGASSANHGLAAFIIGGFMANMRILAGKDSRGRLRTACLCLVAYIFGPMFVIVDVALVYPTSFALEKSGILSSTYYVKRLYWLIFGMAPIFYSDLGHSITLFVGVALLDLVVISPRIYVLTGVHKQSSPWVLYDPFGRLLRWMWPPKMKRSASALVPTSLQVAAAGDLSSTEDLRRRACDALEELQEQLATDAVSPAVKGGMGVLRSRATAAKVADKAAKYAASDPPSDSRMDNAKLALRFQVDRLLSEELPRLAGTQLRTVLAALRQYTPPQPSGAHGKLGAEQVSDPCEGLLQLEQQLRAVLSTGAAEEAAVDASLTQEGGPGAPTTEPHPMRAVYLAEGLDADLWSSRRVVTRGDNKYWTKSHDAETCDWFVSHNWGDSGTRKVALLRQHLNLQKMVAGVLVVLGVLSIYLIPFGFALNDLAPSIHPAWPPLSSVFLTVLVLAWIKGSTLGLVWKKCTPWAVIPTTLWIDKCCVDQTRITEFLETGLKTYLVKCNGMVAFVSKEYFTRLWCVYELATFCKHWSGPDELSSRLVFLSLDWRFCATFFHPELTAEELEWLEGFSCRKARCFKPIDRADVLAAIREQWGSEEQFDTFVREKLPKVFRADKRRHGARFWIQVKQMFDIAFGG